MVRAEQFGNHFLLDVSEALLALGIEELPDAATDLALDHRITVAERHAETAGEMPADSRLAPAGHANQADEHARSKPGTDGPGINVLPCAR